MKKLLAALAGIAGLAWLRRRKPEPASADPAAELRARLAETREPEPQPAPEPEAPADVDSRRSDVHDRARQAIDDLSPSEE